MAENTGPDVPQVQTFDVELPLAFTNGHHLMRLIMNDSMVEAVHVASKSEVREALMAWAKRYPICLETYLRLLSKACRTVNRYNHEIGMPH